MKLDFNYLISCALYQVRNFNYLIFMVSLIKRQKILLEPPDNTLVGNHSTVIRENIKWNE